MVVVGWGELLYCALGGCGLEQHHRDAGPGDSGFRVVAVSRNCAGGFGNIAAVVISRSGRTSEAVRAAQLLEREKKIRVLAVTGTPDQPLEQAASATLPLLPCDEQSTVMTRSFTSMLIGLKYLAACQANHSPLLDALSKLPGLAQKAMDSLHPRVREFAGARRFADYVCLGQGPSTVWPARPHSKSMRCRCRTRRIFTRWNFVMDPRRLLDRRR